MKKNKEKQLNLSTIDLIYNNPPNFQISFEDENRVEYGITIEKNQLGKLAKLFYDTLIQNGIEATFNKKEK